jgi:large subunit ribosomal protein L13
MIKTTVAKKGEVEQQWWVVDAADTPLGRLAVRLATVLMGKHKPIYTPHVDTGDFVVVINAAKVKLTGRKADTKEYKRYSGYPGGLKRVPFKEMLARRPEYVFKQAVARMLPKSTLGRHMLAKMKVYAGPEHPHQAQAPSPLKV